MQDKDYENDVDDSYIVCMMLHEPQSLLELGL